MALSKIKQAFLLASVEFNSMFRTTKILLYVMMAIFINVQVSSSLVEIYNDMHLKMSFVEPFIALCNSEITLFILPIFYVVIISDSPRNDNNVSFFKIRTTKFVWVLGNVLYLFWCSVFTVIYLFSISVLMSINQIELCGGYSRAVREYRMVFPEKAYSYQALLFPSKLINQLTANETIVYEGFALSMYFLILALILLLFSMFKRKIIGIVVDVMVIVLGIITYMQQGTIKWLFPFAHTLSYSHFKEYTSEVVFPLHKSVEYLLLVAAIMVITVLLLARKIKE